VDKSGRFHSCELNIDLVEDSNEGIEAKTNQKLPKTSVGIERTGKS